MLIVLLPALEHPKTTALICAGNLYGVRIAIYLDCLPEDIRIGLRCTPAAEIDVSHFASLNV